jgi:hypothetical protein
MFELNMSKKDKRFSQRNTLLYKVIHNASKGMDPPLNFLRFEIQIIDSMNWALLLINSGVNGYLSQPHIQWVFVYFYRLNKLLINCFNYKVLI